MFTFDTSKNPGCVHPYNGPLKDFVTSANKNITSFLNRQRDTNTLKFSKEKDEFVESSRASEIKMSTKEQHLNVGPKKPDTWIFPSIQMGNLGIRQDEHLTASFIDATGREKGSKIVFGTGYFNLTDENMHAIIHQSKANFEILCAHPRANSFYNAPFPLYGVPFAYSLISKHFLQLCGQRGVLNRVQLFEYERPKWTFHAKGEIRKLCEFK